MMIIGSLNAGATSLLPRTHRKEHNIDYQDHSNLNVNCGLNHHSDLDHHGDLDHHQSTERGRGKHYDGPIPTCWLLESLHCLIENDLLHQVLLKMRDLKRWEEKVRGGYSTPAWVYTTATVDPAPSKVRSVNLYLVFDNLSLQQHLS